MQVLYPAFALMALTMFCMARLGVLRYTAVRKGEMDPRYYVLFRGFDEPDKLAAYSRHVTNLFEAPLLFYVIVVTAFVTEQTSNWVVGLAWTYVGFRTMHTYVHLCAPYFKCRTDPPPHLYPQHANSNGVVGRCVNQPDATIRKVRPARESWSRSPSE